MGDSIRRSADGSFEHLALDLRDVIRLVLLAISGRSSQARGQDRVSCFCFRDSVSISTVGLAENGLWQDHGLAG